VARALEQKNGGGKPAFGGQAAATNAGAALCA